MKVLILSCSTGEGHNSAAKAIYEEMKNKKVSCKMIDALSLASLKTAKIVADSFNNIAKNAPKMFGLMYKAGDLVSNNIIKSPVYLANILYAKKLYKYIILNKIDVVICSHLFPMEALTYLKLRYDLKAKCYGILTDYTCIPFLEETKMDYYFVGHKDVSKELIKKHIPKNKIIALGIPVSSKFKTNTSSAEARRMLKLPLNKKLILIMTGGVGCGNVLEIIKSLLSNLDQDVNLIILVGRNNELKAKITDSFYQNKRIKVVSFTKKVNLYMDACDLLLTKPGGLSSTEAAVKNIPFIHTMPIPGCETKNACFFAKHHMSLKVTNLKDLVIESKKILSSQKLKKQMLDNQIKCINKNATLDICDYIIKSNI